jgi:hypothetical protein
MGIHHALSGELINIRPLRSAITTGRTATLDKAQNLAVLRMVPLASREMPGVAGRLRVQCRGPSVDGECLDE